MEMVLTAFRSHITEMPNGQTVMKFFPLRRDEAGNMILDDEGNPIPDGIPVVLVWTQQGLASFKENLIGARARIVKPGQFGPVVGGNGT